MKPVGLRLYRRHVAGCDCKENRIDYSQCGCPIWADGRIAGKRFRRSLDTADPRTALSRADRIEHGVIEVTTCPSLSFAVKEFLTDCAARKIRESTTRSYSVALGNLTATVGDPPLTRITVSQITQHIRGRAVTAATIRKELMIYRGFFQYCMVRKWITESPVIGIRLPRSQSCPTLPYTADEVTRLLDACEKIQPRHSAASMYRRRARALVLLLLYSGLRISDAAKLQRSALQATGHLILRTLKTGFRVQVQLPPVAIEALTTMKPKSNSYFFWDGRCLTTCINSLRGTIVRLGQIAGVQGKPHRFRDTFAVGLLEKGVDIRRIQLLLGHSSVTTTEFHYLAFMPNHQRMLDEATRLLDFVHGAMHTSEVSVHSAVSVPTLGASSPNGVAVQQRSATAIQPNLRGISPRR